MTPRDALEVVTEVMRMARHECANGPDCDACKVDQQALATLAALVERAGEPVWRPIETAPKDGTRVLLHYAPRRLTKVGRWDAAYNYWAADQFLHERPPTHWQPLPLPPAADEAKP